jgi:hypothetical protein
MIKGPGKSARGSKIIKYVDGYSRTGWTRDQKSKEWKLGCPPRIPPSLA